MIISRINREHAAITDAIENGDFEHATELIENIDRTTDTAKSLLFINDAIAAARIDGKPFKHLLVQWYTAVYSTSADTTTNDEPPAGDVEDDVDDNEMLEREEIKHLYDTPPRTWLIPDWLPTRAVGVFTGFARGLFSREIAARLATGRLAPLLDYPDSTPIKVAYVSNQINFDSFYDYISEMVGGVNALPANLDFISMKSNANPENWQTSVCIQKEVDNAADGKHYQLIIIDIGFSSEIPSYRMNQMIVSWRLYARENNSTVLLITSPNTPDISSDMPDFVWHKSIKDDAGEYLWQSFRSIDCDFIDWNNPVELHVRHDPNTGSSTNETELNRKD